MTSILDTDKPLRFAIGVWLVSTALIGIFLRGAHGEEDDEE